MEWFFIVFVMGHQLWTVLAAVEHMFVCTLVDCCTLWTLIGALENILAYSWRRSAMETSLWAGSVWCL